MSEMSKYRVLTDNYLPVRGCTSCGSGINSKISLESSGEGLCQLQKKRQSERFYCSGFGHSLVLSTLTLLKEKRWRKNKKTKAPSKWTKLNRKIETGLQGEKVHLCFAHQGLPHLSIAIFVCVCVRQCTDVCVIPSCCWQALESEFHIKKGKCFNIDREHWANSTLLHNAKPLH